MTKSTRLVIGLIVSVAVVGSQMREAHAQATTAAAATTTANALGAGILAAALIATLGIVDIGTTVTLIGNTVYAAKNTRPKLSWPITGYIFGGLSLIAGTTLTVIVLPYGSYANQAGYSWAYTIPLAFGITSAVLGALDIAISVVAHTRPERPMPLVVSPIVVPDRDGRAAPGIGLALTRF